MTPRTTRTQRLAMPLARDVVRDLAAEHGGCIRPVQLRRTDLHTGQVEQVLIPCGHTLATVCPACAERAKTLRAAQCREGWHLDTEPVDHPRRPDDVQRTWVEHRADAQQMHDQAEAAGQRHAAELDELAAELDEEITRSGVRGNVLPKRQQRRHRSTRRRQDTPDLPRRPSTPDGRQDLHRAGRQDVPPVHVPDPDLRQLRQGRRGRHPGRPGRATTTSARRGTRCTSPRCSTGSSRTCAAWSATTSSTSPPSSRRGGWPRTSTWRSAAPCPAPSCARCSPPPTTRSGGPRPTGQLRRRAPARLA